MPIPNCAVIFGQAKITTRYINDVHGPGEDAVYLLRTSRLGSSQLLAHRMAMAAR
jgi:hypothetical protein